METFIKSGSIPQRNSKIPVKVVAFDCDGVLFDSTKANQAYYNQVLRYFGRPDMTEAQFAYTHMHTADESMAFLFSDNDDLAAAQAYRKQMGYVQFIELMVIEPHLLSVLPKIRTRFKTAIATNRTDTMEKVLEIHQLENQFDLVVCASDVRAPKPHPESLLKVAGHFNVSPDETLYIGDSKVDEQAAIAAGMPLVAYANSNLAAAYHIENLKALESILGITD
jgi:HAD superfamily hydrolase (TIGR01509 family)